MYFKKSHKLSNIMVKPLWYTHTIDDYAGISEHVPKDYLMISASIYYKVNLEQRGRGEGTKEKENSKLYTQSLQDITGEPELRFCR